MQPQQILKDQRITLKRGRTNGLGFEPAFNSYFDFYLSSKYVDPPLLQLEDVTFHLYLRKNLNDSNPDWRMPSYKQIQRKFRIGQGKITSMLARLERAHLLVKVSGVRKDGPNVNNEYILSDPIAHLDEFLTVVEAGVFTPISKTDTGGTSEIDIASTPETDEGATSELDDHKQTSPQQTIWNNVLSLLKKQTTEATYNTFLDGTQLESVCDAVAVITTTKSYAVDWLSAQMANQIRRMLSVETGGKISVVEVKIVSP